MKPEIVLLLVKAIHMKGNNHMMVGKWNHMKEIEDRYKYSLPVWQRVSSLVSQDFRYTGELRTSLLMYDCILTQDFRYTV